MTLDDRLSLIEAQLRVVLRALEIREEVEELKADNARAYRRGYRVGWNAGRNGADADPEKAVKRQRRR